VFLVLNGPSRETTRVAPRPRCASPQAGVHSRRRTDGDA
jgi:hypothetical protein